MDFNTQPNLIQGGDVHRVILNANLDLTNVVGFNDFSDIAIDTLEDIVKTILPLCGPNAVHDLVIYEHLASEFVSNVFSNDGIHILKSIEHMSPLQKYITGYISYISDRVDRASSDGTSTAIYFSSRIIISMLKRMKNYRNEIDSSGVDNVDFNIYANRTAHNLSKLFVNTIENIVNELEKCNIDLNAVSAELKQELIYKLSYTTSKGQEKLSKFVVELFKDLPEELYEHTFYKRAQNETDYDYLVEYPEHDASIKVMASPTTKYNTELGTELVYEDCDLIVVPNWLSDVKPLVDYLLSRDVTAAKRDLELKTTAVKSDQADIDILEDRLHDMPAEDDDDYNEAKSNHLTKLLDKAKAKLNLHVSEMKASQKRVDELPEHERKLVILHNGANDSDMVLLEKTVDPETTTLCRYIVTHPTFQGNPTELQAILSMASVNTTVWKKGDDYKESIIKNVKCHIVGNALMIYNLFETDPESIIHPNFRSKDNVLYNKLATELSNKIASIKITHSQQKDTQELQDFVRIYRMLVCSKIPVLTVGGNTTEHLANINVVNDVMGVVSVAMKYGVVIDLVPKLLSICNQLDDSVVSSDITDILSDYIRLTYNKVEENEPSGLLANQYTYVDDVNETHDIDTEDELLAEIDKVKVVQSFKAITETFRRLLETVPKLITTEQIIVPNSIMKKPEKKE